MVLVEMVLARVHSLRITESHRLIWKKQYWIVRNENE